MKKIIDYFEKTCIVSLPQAHRLRAQTSAEFKLVGWTIDNNKVKFFDAIRPDQRLNFSSIGTRGCFESHLSLIKEFISTTNDKNKGNLLVFEDDISFTIDLNYTPKSIANILEENDYDIIFFGYKSDDIKPSSNKFEIVTVPSNVSITTSHFYALHRRCLRDYIAHLEGILFETNPSSLGHMHYDGAINWFRKLNPDIKTLVCTTPLGIQRPSRSLISDSAGFKNIFPEKWLDGVYYFYSDLQRFAKSIAWKYLN